MNPTLTPQQGTPQLDQGVVNLAKAIRQTESGGNFSAKGASGEHGAYQFTPDTWNATAPKYNINVPIEQATPEQQNAVAYNKIKEWKDAGNDVTQIASMWNAGVGEPNAYTGKFGSTTKTHRAGDPSEGVNSYGVKYSVPNYARSVATAYQTIKGGGDVGVDPNNPSSTAGTEIVDTPQQGEETPTYGATFPASSSDNGLVAGFKALGNMPSSVYGFGEGLVNSLRHPIDTVKNLGGAAIGGVENLTGQNKGNPDEYQQTANALGDSLNQRTGIGDFVHGRFDAGLNKLSNTATNDPFGFGTDVVSILAGGAGLVGKGAELSELGSRVAQTAGKPFTKAGNKIADMTLGGSLPEVAGASTRTGVDLPAAAYTKNSIINAGEALAATGGGEAAYSARVDRSLAQMEAVANKIVTNAGGSLDLSTAGETIAKGLTDYEKTFHAANDEVFSAIRSSIGNVAAKTEGTASLLDKIISQKEALGEVEGIKYFRDKLDVVNGAREHAAPTLETLKQLRTVVGKKMGSAFNDPFVTVNQSALKSLYGSLTNDIRNTILYQRKPQVLAMYDKANAAYRAGYEVISSQYAKKIRTLAENGQESKIVDALIKPATAIEDIPRIMNVAGPEGVKQIQTSVLQKIFDGAKVDGDFTPMGIKKVLNKFGEEKLAAILSPEQIQGVKDLGTLTESMKNIMALQKGTSPQFLAKMALQFKSLGEPAAILWAGYSLMTGDVVGAVTKIAAVAGVEGASRFLASNMGNTLLKWGALHGSEFAKVAKAEGLTPPDTSGNMNIYGNDTSSVAGSADSANGVIPGRQNGGGNVPPSPVDSGAVSKLKKVAKKATPAFPLLQELANQRNFDLQGARDAEHSDQSIHDFLSESPTQ